MSLEAGRHWSWRKAECWRNDTRQIKFIKRIRSNARDRDIRRAQTGACMFRDHCEHYDGGCPNVCNMRKLAEEKDLNRVRSGLTLEENIK